MNPISAGNFSFQLNPELFCICKIVPTYPSPTSSSTGALQRCRRRFPAAGWLGVTGLDLNRPPCTLPDPAPLLCWGVLPSPRRAAEPRPCFSSPASVPPLISPPDSPRCLGTSSTASTRHVQGSRRLFTASCWHIGLAPRRSSMPPRRPLAGKRRRGRFRPSLLPSSLPGFTSRSSTPY